MVSGGIPLIIDESLNLRDSSARMHSLGMTHRRDFVYYLWNANVDFFTENAFRGFGKDLVAAGAGRSLPV